MAKRRPSGDGMVRKKEDGSWEGRVVIGYDEKNLPKTKNVLAKTKSECVEKLKQLQEQYAPPKSDKISQKEFDSIVDEALALYFAQKGHESEQEAGYPGTCFVGRAWTPGLVR